jgi:hypothetical protein
MELPERLHVSCFRFQVVDHDWRQHPQGHRKIFARHCTARLIVGPANWGVANSVEATCIGRTAQRRKSHST